jgi:hypothetical protein
MVPVAALGVPITPDPRGVARLHDTWEGSSYRCPVRQPFIPFGSKVLCVFREVGFAKDPSD